MEVKIKNNGEMLDSTIEMVDGVMVVSPKEEKVEPKNGDVVVSPMGNVAIFSHLDDNKAVFYHCVYLTFGELKVKHGKGIGYYKDIRPATEGEKKKLFDKLAEEGYEWDADNKELVKLKWKPYEGGDFWLPYYNSMMFAPTKGMFNIGRDKSFLDKGWVFRTEEECQAFCDKLDEAINSVKP